MMEVKDEEVKEPEVQEEENFFEQMKSKDVEKIIKFIKKYRTKNISDLDIKQVLLEKGWEEETVDEAFAQAKEK